MLAAEISASGQIVRSQADWSRLATDGHTAVPVIRIEGQIGSETTDRLVADIAGIVGALPASVRGRVEVDHDSATARLAGYARFLRTLRSALAPGTMMSITALPTWMGSPDFALMAETADLLILQVHSIDDPRVGLFDPRRAERWVDALARRTRRPFLVALPAYGARVAASATGKLLAVSAEMHALDGEAGSEVAASPKAIRSFLEAMRRDAPDTFRGIVWFRLPTADDRRALSAATLRAVITGQALVPRIEVVSRPGWALGTSDIVLLNQGDIDGRLPASVRLPIGCERADGVGEYERDGTGLRLRGNGSGLLRAHGAVLVGWMRCDGDLHADK